MDHQTRRVQTTTSRILNFLATQEFPKTKLEIFLAFRGRKQDKVTALNNLIRDGKIIRFGTGVRRSPFKYKRTIVPSSTFLNESVRVVEEVLL